MYVVIFKAEIKNLDDAYYEMASKLRTLAIDQYGCQEFNAVSEDGFEIAVSYWKTLEQIHRWKQDEFHIAAQQQGKNKWYKNYTVQITEVLREYSA